MRKNKRTGRIVSAALILLLILQIAGAGVPTAFAQEFPSGEFVYVGDLKVGDVIDEGAVLCPDLSGDVNGINYAQLIVDSEDMNKDSGWYSYNGNMQLILDKDRAEYTNEQKLTVTGIEPSAYSKYKTTVYLSIYNERDAVTAQGVTDEAELIKALDSDETIVLANSIELSDCFFVRDGREHTLDLNGCTLSRDMQSKEATGHVLQVNAGSKLTIIDECDDDTGLITGGWAPNGGGIYVGGELVLDECVITGNEAEYGGGIYVKGGSVTVNKGVVIEENTANNGGGIFVAEGSVTVNKGGVIRMNEAKFGGGFYFQKGSSAMNSAVIECNKASRTGGGIYNGHADLVLNNSSVTMNTAEEAGAGIINYGTMTLKSSEISHNTNAKDGGGIYNYDNASMTVDNCEISGNSVSGKGGGILLEKDSQTRFTGDNRIGENYAERGGGIYIHKNRFELDHMTIENNSAGGCGGGIYYDYSQSGKLILKKVSVTQNAGGSGANNAGGIYMDAGVLELAGGKTIVSSNTGSNTNSNIVFAEFRKIVVTGELKSGSSIGVTLPEGLDNYDVTEGYSSNNTLYANQIFFSDTQYYRVLLDKDNKIPEARFVKRLQATANSYTLKVTVKVTDDADWWDYAYLYIYGRDNNGQSAERYLTCSPDFCDYIDSSDGYYEYYLDCGKSFPSTVMFRTMYGTGGSWRDFEADVKVYINGVNCAYAHCVHNVYGVQEKDTYIKIGGDKYPYPDLDIDQRAFIDPTDPSSGYVTISAVDQYGLAWSTVNNSYKMVNKSFDKEDFAEDVGNGLKWKMSTKKESDHYSKYRLTFYSSSNVYPEITNDIIVHFAYPMQLKVIVDGETVFATTGTANSLITIEDYPCKTGYYIYGYKASDACFLDKNEDGKTYLFRFGKGDITLTAITKGVRYYVQFDKNAEDATKTMKVKALTYDKEPTDLGKNCFKRAGYVFAGWNTKPDGSGRAFADNEAVQNLSTVAGDIVMLYAQWQPEDTGVTASIFSSGTIMIYIGGAIILLSLIAAAVYAIKKKKQKQA